MRSVTQSNLPDKFNLNLFQYMMRLQILKFFKGSYFFRRFVIIC